MQQRTIAEPRISLSDMSIDEMNTIFAALEELPHKRVSGLIGKMIKQVNDQLAPPRSALDLNGGAVGSGDQTEIPPGANGGIAAGLSDPE